jgi:hypothetical protein
VVIGARGAPYELGINAMLKFSQKNKQQILKYVGIFLFLVVIVLLNTGHNALAAPIFLIALAIALRKR